ncbi:GNAT family N-acetyltransferase [Agarivorans sp. OAG1]|uniref:GNAT family N-acetyltransferase n=1 Tax=Agarivorans sp. OAG1 TaxID=3082387 RepID=UPI0030CFD99A
MKVCSESSFSTERLKVSKVCNKHAIKQEAGLLSHIVELLRPAVVEALPPYFQNINNEQDALRWLNTVCSESQLFAVSFKDQALPIGFLFVHEQSKSTVHIGYLLGEAYWRQGIASELLSGFIDWAKQQTPYHCLVAGLDGDNQASKRLLLKLGFSLQATSDANTQIYHYNFPS